jgi:hypothetical protein
VERVEGKGRVETAAKSEGRNMTMVLGPDRRGAKPKAATESAPATTEVPETTEIATEE